MRRKGKREVLFNFTSQQMLRYAKNSMIGVRYTKTKKLSYKFDRKIFYVKFNSTVKLDILNLMEMCRGLRK